MKLTTSKYLTILVIEEASGYYIKCNKLIMGQMASLAFKQYPGTSTRPDTLKFALVSFKTEFKV